MARSPIFGSVLPARLSAEPFGSFRLLERSRSACNTCDEFYRVKMGGVRQYVRIGVLTFLNSSLGHFQIFRFDSGSETGMRTKGKK